MKCSQLIKELVYQMNRSGDLGVVVILESEDGYMLEADVEEVVRIGNGPIVLQTGPVD